MQYTISPDKKKVLLVGTFLIALGLSMDVLQTKTNPKKPRQLMAALTL